MLSTIITAALGDTLKDMKETIVMVAPIFVIFFGFNLYADILEARRKRKRLELRFRHEEVRARIDEINLKLAEIRLRKAEAEEKARMEYAERMESMREEEEREMEEKEQAWREDLELIIAEIEEEEARLEHELEDEIYRAEAK